MTMSARDHDHVRIPWHRIARDPTVVHRALFFAVIVGAILISINHGDALLTGDLTVGRLIRIGLTVLVPYVVSTLSSVAAIRAAGRGSR